ncbi:Phospholipid phosphatase-related protein type 5, partial [Nibea albiflora]
MAGTVLLAYYFEYTDTFPIHIQGFFCYDKTFSKPYPGPDDTSKIPPVLIYSLVTAIPTITVILVLVSSQLARLVCELVELVCSTICGSTDHQTDSNHAQSGREERHLGGPVWLVDCHASLSASEISDKCQSPICIHNRVVILHHVGGLKLHAAVCVLSVFSHSPVSARSTQALGLMAAELSFTELGIQLILVGELCAFFTKAEGTQEKTIVTADCCYFNPLLRRIIRFLGVYAFGLFTTTIFANAGQVVTGNQTPHFLSACRPNYTALGCQSTMQYIAERRACTGNPLVVMSARKSFPSKDAALSVYSAVYTVMYVTLVFKTKGTRLTKPTISLTLLCLAMLVGVVRVAEYRNHWADVLAGFFTGGSIAVFLVTCVINNFQQMQPSPPPPRPQRPESVLGMPMVTLPCVESPLEKLSGPQVRGGGGCEAR